MKKLRFVALLLLLASSSELPAQGFSSVNSDLDQLESLIIDTLLNAQDQQRQLADLKQTLNESGSLIGSYESTITRLERYAMESQIWRDEMLEIYRTQSASLAKYEKSSRFWKAFTLIGIPAAALLSGGIAWAMGRR